MSNAEPVFERTGEQIRIRGLVQGVGFRPTVYRIAQQLKLFGEVRNDGEGVWVMLQASARQVDEFIAEIQSQCPPLARIDSIERSAFESDLQYQSFTICASQSGNIHTGIVPDAATCGHCLHDMRDPENRRFNYAFTNCTHCGPRLSIVEHVPYDRAYTSMKHFQLCSSCQKEYDDPQNRRFHAQPNACPVCGPFIKLTDANGNDIPGSDIVSQTAMLIRQGKILAIKGIGGFQLACDASNDDSVSELRSRKRRPFKALALMASSIEQISEYCEVDEVDRQLLQSSAAPIVILPVKAGACSLSPALAPGQRSLGFMLPYSPLHHALMQQLDVPVVMTSGNASEEPQCIDNRQALDQLGHIADYFVLHNRDIVNRIDDSVVRSLDGAPVFYRRARGYAPAPMAMPAEFQQTPPILALGGEMKNTFCQLKQCQATLSQHMGNLENLHTYNDYLKNIDLYQQLFDFNPQALVIDTHPEYLSSKLGRQWSSERQIPLIEVQHHHAHIASCMADNLWPSEQGPVIGVALDGLGYGDDGTIWGGEFLQVDYCAYTRLASLKPVALAGGSRAITEPWRNTYAHITAASAWAKIVEDYPDLAIVQFLQQQQLGVLDTMIMKGMNSPLCSSAGRLFDAFAATLGICPQSISYEGQAAIELEAMISDEMMQRASPYPFQVQAGEIDRIDTAPMWSQLFEDLKQHKDFGLISARFHLTLAHIIHEMVLKIHRQSGITTVALSGGVFQNITLLELTTDLLSRQHLNVLSHTRVPANDGGLALGQAAIAASRLRAGEINVH